MEEMNLGITNPAVEPEFSEAPSRRTFLTGMAGLGAAALAGGELLSGAAKLSPRRIDVHHHLKPQFYADFIAKYNQPSPGMWSLDTDLADMDKSGTETAILSFTTPGFAFAEKEEARKMVRQCNDYSAKLCADHPGKFGQFASLSFTDIDASLKEIEYALDTLKADGISLFSSFEDKWLGNKYFDPIYQELNRRKVVIYVHPNLASCCASIPGKGLPDVPNENAMVEFGTDTTRAIAEIIFGGNTTRFPDITWIFSHAGGNMPFAIERFLLGSSAEVVPGITTKGMGTAKPPVPAGGVLPELRKLYYDTAQTSNPVAMGALKKVVPVSQILFGTDFWYRTAEETGRGLETCGVFNAQELRAINRGNSERILPQYAKKAAHA